MTHIEEGTIHAWLDGVLGAEEAAAVESHVRGCARCAEAVAEARGLVAASSRILGALDDVPGGVILNPAPAKKHQRIWRAAPWVTGIAAVLMAAVVLRTGYEVRREVPFIAVEKVSSAQPELVVDTAAEAVRPRTQASQVVASPPAAARPSRAVVGSASAGTGAPGGAGAVARPAPSSDAPAESRKAAGEARGRETREDYARAGEVSRRQRAQPADAAVTSAPLGQAPVQPPMVEVPMPQRSALIDMPTVRPIDPQRDAVPVFALAGCYRVTTEARPALTLGVASEASRMRARGAAPAAPSEVRVPNQIVVRLDSLAGRPGWFIVREARSDSSVGWWYRVNADSARVDLLTSGIALVAGRDRIACPER